MWDDFFFFFYIIKLKLRRFVLQVKVIYELLDRVTSYTKKKKEDLSDKKFDWDNNMLRLREDFTLDSGHKKISTH